MPNLNIFELPEMAKILGIDPARAKNWTNGRTGVVIEPSIRKIIGTGKRNLYSLEDLYLMGIARDLSLAGFAAKAIGDVLKVITPKLDRRAESVTLWRQKKTFHVGQGRTKPEGATVWHTIALKSLLDGIDEAVEKAGGR